MSRLSAALLCLALLCAAAAPAAAAAKPACTGRPGAGGWTRLKQQEIRANAVRDGSALGVLATRAPAAPPPHAPRPASPPRRRSK
jgi:hypothetical protein